MSDSGELQIVKTSPKEDVLNQTTSKLSSIFYIAWSIWNISTKIKRITITNWLIKNQSGICWFMFNRNTFEQIDPTQTNVIELCKDVRHVFDLKNNALQPIRYNLFHYAIQEGKYDDDTLLNFVKVANAIERAPLPKERVERPQIDKAKGSSLYNDLDYGYDLSVKPVFDDSFANLCYKIIEYEDCSLEMFVKELSMSLDRAKDFMGKLLYLHIVGEKHDDGRRKVLVKTEAALEFKLSWLYHNESWRY